MNGVDEAYQCYFSFIKIVIFSFYLVFKQNILLFIFIVFQENVNYLAVKSVNQSL